MVSRPRVSLDRSASGGGTAARIQEREHKQIRSRMGSDRFIGNNCCLWKGMASGTEIDHRARKSVVNASSAPQKEASLLFSLFGGGLGFDRDGFCFGFGQARRWRQIAIGIARVVVVV